MKRILDFIPSNWCDPLLTGENSVIGNPPYDCKDIEALLNGIRERAISLLQSEDSGDLKCPKCGSKNWQKPLTCFNCGTRIV